MRIYFDHNATTPVDLSVADAMMRVLREDYGNASSVHRLGQQAKAILDEARTAVAALLSAQSPQNLCSRAAEPRPTISRCAEPPRRWSRPAGAT